MRYLIGLAALLAACGGEKGGQPAPSAAPAAAAPAAQPPPTGTVHDVGMDLVNGKYRFTPSTLTIKPGDVVRWINTSGGPHNVQFNKDKIPAGAEAVLNAAMASRLQSLTGPYLTAALATYQVSFADAPPGTYAYTCQPHEKMGMNGTVTVQP